MIPSLASFVSISLPTPLISLRSSGLAGAFGAAFLGAAFGGVIGGILFEAYAVSGIIYVGCALLVLWVLLLWLVKPVKKAEPNA